MFRKVFLYFILAVCLGVSGEALFGQETGTGGTGKNSEFTSNTKPDLSAYSAEVKWERYKISESEISVLFPKQPVYLSAADSCSEIDTNIYYAFAREVVYTMRISSKSKIGPNRYCEEKILFEKNSFGQRVKELKKSGGKSEEKSLDKNGREFLKIVDGYTTYYLYNDFNDKRWYELWVTHREGVEPEIDNFLGSILFEKNSVGKEINNGASQTLGDLPRKKTEEENKSVNSNTETEKKPATQTTGSPADTQNLILIHKPQARYTDAARQANIQGTVLVKVTFLYNGGVGSVTPVSGLPYGLTEEAVKAAKKIAFIPKKSQNTLQTSVRTVAYTFTIY